MQVKQNPVMKNRIARFWLILAVVVCGAGNFVLGNPTGGTVRQGSATFNSSGSQLTITTSQNAFINWQSFNIGLGETTTFVQPSSSSLVWNQISDSNPSQILGSLNANGYVVLQNQNGFYIGGQAAITAHGLILTTTPLAVPDLSSSGPWSFSAPPPTAKIVNYGQINIGGGGSAFLIANDIENDGSITAPGGNVGLYAGEQVLVSTRPDGRGLSASVTLPEGSVDNSGKLIADGGSIAMQAQVVNQGGLVQANTVADRNGTIELLASAAVNLGANSSISAQGDSTGVSSGGSVTIKSGNTFSDQTGSTINIAGGAQGGNGGALEISAPNLGTIQSQISAGAAAGYHGGTFTLDPTELDLTAAYVSTLTPILNSGLYQLNLQADDTIKVDTLWTLNDPGAPALLTLTAGNDIIFDSGSKASNPNGIKAQNDWSVSLSAGPQNLASKPTTSLTDGIYLNGFSYLQSANGNINVWAANEVILSDPSSFGTADSSGIRTTAGGNINVTAEIGNVNTGGDSAGFVYQSTAPYITASPTVGGISTAAGGNVTITAGGNVTSFLPSGNQLGNSAPSASDGGTGAFGSNPGNVTITAGGSVYGHYVVADGIGSITAGKDAGDPGNPFALSLIDGSWTVNAPYGNIYLQEVRNPNGIFNTLIQHGTVAPGKHLFTYDPESSVTLDAGIGVELTGTDTSVPRLGSAAIQILYPPILNITAGSGGVTLDGPVTLFPSPYGNLNITTTGNGSLTGNGNELLMSDSALSQWAIPFDFSDQDHGSTLDELNNFEPVTLNIAGNMDNLTLLTTKETKINVGGNMNNVNFSGENLHPGDETSIHVGGQIFYTSSLTFVPLPGALPTLPENILPPGVQNNWDTIFELMMDPNAIKNLVIPANVSPAAYENFAVSASVFGIMPGGTTLTGNPGFVYSPTTGQLGFIGPMSQAVSQSEYNDLASGQFTVLVYKNGIPETQTSASGVTTFVTTTINWAPAAQIAALYQDSANAPNGSSPQYGLRVGGPGQFEVSAGSISLGNSYGILSEGAYDLGGINGVYGDRYQNLAQITPSGADLNVTAAGNIDMLTSTIATLGGGNVTLNSTGGSMDLGTEESPVRIPSGLGFGVYTAGPGNVSVTAFGSVDVDGSRIGAFDGGNVSVESLTENVNAGSGGANAFELYSDYVNPVTGQAGTYAEQDFGSGIIANTLVDPSQVPGGALVPGNITVETPRGDIDANQGGIVQEALNGNVAAGPTVTLVAGTPASAGSPGYAGNIDLGQSGVIGGTVDVTANGNITGLVISRQNSDINAAQTFSGTVLSGGQANLSATSVSGTSTIIGVGGVSVAGTIGAGAQVLGQSVSVNGGATVSTLGTSAQASTAATSASGEATEQAVAQVSTDNSQDDDQKKKGKGAGLVRRTGRVTVMLPGKS